MSPRVCAACTTSYAPDLGVCPHCGSIEYTEDGVLMARRLPAYVSVSCTRCSRGPWQLRLPVVATGLIQLPTLHCASCGSQVQIPWPPKENDMPKITAHGGPTNARETDLSPAVDASKPLVGAEADQGHPTDVEVEGDGSGEALPEIPAETHGKDAEPDVDPYAGLTLAELREAAEKRGLASYGNKAQLTERLREADEAAKSEGSAE